MNDTVVFPQKYWWIAGGMTLAAFVAASAAYCNSPERIPTHWGLNGEVDGYGPRWTLFLLPAVMVGTVGLFRALPWLSPQRFTVDLHRRVYLVVMLISVGLVGYIEAVTLYATLSGGSVGRPFVAGFALFVGLLGNQLGKLERNFYIGVRTPWTLASERVWIETHRLAAWMAAGGGVLAFVLAIIPGIPLGVPLAALLAALLYPAVYSLFLYKRLEKRGELVKSTETLA